MNNLQILGTITRDIELKYLANKKAVANFSIAYNKKYTGADGKLVEKVSFFDVSCFGKQAETIDKFFAKGSRILIQGELEQQTWKANDGSNRSKALIRLEKFDFIDKQEKSYRQSNAYGSNDVPYVPKPQVPQQYYAQGVDEDEIPY